MMGLIVIFVYAFFKFAWSYRLFNYFAIMVGAAPPPDEKDMPAAQTFAHRAARLCTEAGRHFNRGQRAFFFALGYLGWFLGPAPRANRLHPGRLAAKFGPMRAKRSKRACVLAERVDQIFADLAATANLRSNCGEG
jgi:hypothetical protein